MSVFANPGGIRFWTTAASRVWAVSRNRAFPTSCATSGSTPTRRWSPRSSRSSAGSSSPCSFGRDRRSRRTTSPRSLKASKTPVREALIRLEDAGLVTIVPKSGSFVAPIRIDRYIDACFIRLQLETGAVRRAALLAQRDVAVLDGIIDDQVAGPRRRTNTAGSSRWTSSCTMRSSTSPASAASGRPPSARRPNFTGSGTLNGSAASGAAR